ncbi:MAG: metallophosphoesterase [Promethearchaeota archaeon]|nr:MAG: metallophosphoesterase [Candidatus Lokiarchaeota archaeon]
MKLLYVTDIHGIQWKHNRIFQIASSLKPDMVINGGDMLPFKGNLLHQDKFITGFLDEYFSRFESLGIYYLGLLGNDDLRVFDELFQKTCEKYSYVVNTAQTRFQIEGIKYEFIGMNYVSDLPFGLKDRARKDTKDFEFPKQIGKQYLSTPNGFKKVEDWLSYAENLPTIEDELKDLIKPSDMRNTVYIFHNPPANIDLDVTHAGHKVGSKAEYAFLKENQPKLSFHGHIHESPDASGKWYSQIGRTICIQPGQSHQHENYLYCALVDLETMNIERKMVKKTDT